jgi:hypothetical protein
MINDHFRGAYNNVETGSTVTLLSTGVFIQSTLNTLILSSVLCLSLDKLQDHKINR